MPLIYLFLCALPSVFTIPVDTTVSNNSNLEILDGENDFAVPIINQNIRIFNGLVSTPVPYMVSIQRKWFGTLWAQHCGATLISADRLLTANHCFGDDVDAEYRAVFGTLEYMKPAQEITFTSRDVKLNDYLPGLATTSGTVFHSNDNAVVQLPQRVKMDNKTVYPVCLAGKESYPRSTYRVFGWGYYNCKEQSPYLRYSMGQLVDRTTCQNLYNEFSLFKSIRVEDGQICATFVAPDGEGYFDDHADSGGPLVAVVGDEGKHVQVGIVSFGAEIQNQEPACPDPRVPSVFSKVAEYQDFIRRYAPEAQFC